MRKYFFCVGAQKAATTTLDALLRANTRLVLPAEKETKFFCNEELYSKGVSYYDRCFPVKEQLEQDEVWGEVDPEYLFFPNCAARIRRFSPSAKILIILRNPVDRAYSQYLMNVSRGIEPRTFMEAMHDERTYYGGWLDRVHFTYLQRGFYQEQIFRYLNEFGHDNVKLLLFEEFVGAQYDFLVEICNWAGIAIKKNATDGVSIVENQSRNVRSKTLSEIYHGNWAGKNLIKTVMPKPLIRVGGRILKSINSSDRPLETLSAQDRIALEALYSDEISGLGRLMGRKLWWQATR